VLSGKTEFGSGGCFRKLLRRSLETRKKSRRRKLLLWLGIDLLVAAAVAVLLLHKPSGYHPAAPVATDSNGQQVDPYLYRDLSSKFYNDAQRQRPFEMVVLDKALNQAIEQLKWSQVSGGVMLSAPQVSFAPGRIILMGTTRVEGADFVLTIELSPRLDDQGNLNLLVEKVKVGAMNVTLLAKPMARRMFRERIESAPVDRQDIRTKIAASLFNEEPFEPIVKVEDKWVRLKGFDLTDGRLTARFDPVKPPRSGVTPNQSPDPKRHN
jgi:hypothetical protein